MNEKTSRLDLVRAAVLPRQGIEALARFRRDTEIQVLVAESFLWLQWTTDRIDLVEQLFPFSGVQFFYPRDGLWFSLDSRLPHFQLPPPGNLARLDHVLFPQRFSAQTVQEIPIPKIEVRLVPSSEPNPATACRVDREQLEAWSRKATTKEITQLRGVCRGSEAIVIGPLPWMETSERYHGQVIFIALGYRLEPDWPLELWKALDQIPDGLFVFWGRAGIESIPQELFQPLSRAQLQSR